MSLLKTVAEVEPAKVSRLKDDMFQALVFAYLEM